MNTINAYSVELVSNANGDWVEEEKLVVTLEGVVGYSFGTNTFQAMYPDQTINVFPLSRFDRIEILTIPVEDLVPVEAEEEVVH